MEAQKWLEVLEEKIQQLEVPPNEEVEKIISSLEKLEGLLLQIESRIRVKSTLDKKVEELSVRMDKIIQPLGEEEQPPQKTSSFEETLSKISKHARLVARVLDTLASSLQLSLDSAGKLATKSKGGEEEHRDEEANLQAILHPLGTLVQNVVGEKLKKGER